MNGFQDALISYGRDDSKSFAEELHQRLGAEGLEVWFDYEDIPLGVDFQSEINGGIEKAHNFLFIISPSSVNSKYCLKEIEHALKHNKRIIPLLHVEEIDQETWRQRNPNGTDEEWEADKAARKHLILDNMHPAVRKINWVYFRAGIDDFEASLAGLLEIFQRHQDYVHLHTHFLTKALSWEQHQKQSRYLLIGEERQQAEEWLKVHFNDEQPPCIPTTLHCEFITESVKHANNLMTQVFLAHSDKDAALAEQVRHSLMREGITVWTSGRDIETGEDFQAAINRAIEESDNLVYLLSPASLQSDYCRKEIEYALSLNKRIIPLLAGTIDPDQVPSALRDLQYINLTDNVAAADYQQDESQLLKILWQDAAYHKQHKIFLVKALKWKRQYRNPSILLQDHNLRDAESWLKIAQQRTQHRPTSLQEVFINQSLRQPPATSLDVFIAYSEVDSGFAFRLNDALQSQGKTTWFAQASNVAGADFQPEIYHGIERSNNFLFILSPSSVNSLTCINELAYAAQLNKRVIAILHRPLEPQDLHPKLTPLLCELGLNGSSYPYASDSEVGVSSHQLGVSKVQWIDFNQAETDFSSQFNQLVRRLDTDREYVRHHTKWSQQALEWIQKERNEDLLLRGSELVIAESWLQKAEARDKKPAATDLQKAFIGEGRALCDRLQQQSQKRQQIELRARITSWALMVMMVTSSLAGFSIYQWIRAARNYDNLLQVLEQAEQAVDIAQNYQENYQETLKTLNQIHEDMQLAEQEAVPAPTPPPSPETSERVDAPLRQAPLESDIDAIQGNSSTLQAPFPDDIDFIQRELASIRMRLGGEKRTR